MSGSERLWSYGELKIIKLHESGESSGDVATLLNERFHCGEAVRSAQDVDRIKSSGTIFTRKRDRG